MRPLRILWDMRHPITFLSEYIRTPVKLFLNQMFETYRHKTSEKVLSLREILFKASVIALITSCVVWVSVFLYVAFYYSYMPNITHSRPVHLQFKSCDGDYGVCSNPSSHIELTKRQQLLMVGQSYKIKLALDMPESEDNKQLGMFLCCLELRAKKGHLVSQSCRSGILPYKSKLLTYMMTLFYSPLLVTGFKEERKMVEIELFSDYQDNQDTPVTDAYVEIHSQKIQLYSATLYIEAHFTGLRYIMFHWPLISAFVGISTNLLFVAFVCALSWYHLQHGSEDKKLIELENPEVKHLFEDPFFLDSEEFHDSLSIKEKKDDEDSHSSDISSFDDPVTSTIVQTIQTIKKEE